jgi:hypothetical protein
MRNEAIERNTLITVHQLIINAKVVLGLLILVALMMEAIYSSETSVLTRATQFHIP